LAQAILAQTICSPDVLAFPRFRRYLCIQRMAALGKPLIDTKGAKKRTAKKNYETMLPNLEILADNLFDRYEDKMEKVKAVKGDPLSHYDDQNREWLSAIEEEYMAVLKQSSPVGMGYDAMLGLRHRGKLTATLTAAERLLNWVIANPTVGSMLNNHRYIIQKVSQDKTANDVDKATVRLLTVFGLMTLVIAPVDGDIHLSDVLDPHTDRWIDSARGLLKSKEPSDTDVEAAHSTRLMGLDRRWLVEDVQTNAKFVFQMSQHHKTFKPTGKRVWLESRTMGFFSAFLTELVSVLREEASMAQAMQAKVYGSFFTGAFAMINILLKHSGEGNLAGR